MALEVFSPQTSNPHSSGSDWLKMPFGMSSTPPYQKGGRSFPKTASVCSPEPHPLLPFTMATVLAREHWLGRAPVKRQADSVDQFCWEPQCL